MSSAPEPEERGSPEERGPIPWWLWLAVLVILVFAFLVGAFNLCNP